MFRYDRRIVDLDLPRLDLRLVDLLGFSNPVQQEIIAEFDKVFGGEFLESKFPDEELCRDNSKLNPLYNAYVDYDYAEQAAGRVAVRMEDWSRENGAQYVVDHVTLPHEGMRWFELQSIRTGLRVGALQVSRIDLLSLDGTHANFKGHAIMTLPKHATFSYAQYWGEVIKTLIDLPFIDFEDPQRSAGFEEWVFPQDVTARYVARRGNTFGKDVIDQASIGVRLERGGRDVEEAPRTLRKRERSLPVEVVILAQMRDAVVASRRIK